MRRIVILLVGLALLLPQAASAASSTCQAYNPQTCSALRSSRNDGPVSGTLPFTGINVTLLAAGGVALLGVGLLVRRAARHLG